MSATPDVSPRLTLPAGQLDLDAQRFRRADKTLKLTDAESNLLRYLLDRRGEDVARADLLVEVWGYAATVNSRAVDQTVKRLRKKIERDPKDPEVLLSVFGVGYRLRLPALQPRPHVPPQPSPLSSVIAEYMAKHQTAHLWGPLWMGAEHLATTLTGSSEDSRLKTSPHHPNSQSAIEVGPPSPEVALGVLQAASTTLGHPLPIRDGEALAKAIDNSPRVARFLAELLGPYTPRQLLRELERNPGRLLSPLWTELEPHWAGLTTGQQQTLQTLLHFRGRFTSDLALEALSVSPVALHDLWKAGWLFRGQRDGHQVDLWSIPSPHRTLLRAHVPPIEDDPLTDALLAQHQALSSSTLIAVWQPYRDLLCYRDELTFRYQRAQSRKVELGLALADILLARDDLFSAYRVLSDLARAELGPSQEAEVLPRLIGCEALTSGIQPSHVERLQSLTTSTPAHCYRKARVLGAYALRSGDRGHAAQLAQETLRSLQQTGDPGWIGAAWILQGRHHGELGGDLDRATACFQHALDVLMGQPEERSIAYAQYCLGYAALEQVDAGRARHHFGEAIHRLITLNDPMGTSLQSVMALCDLARDEPREALERLSTIQREIADHGTVREAVEDAETAAISYLLLGQPKAALQQAKEHIALARKWGRRVDTLVAVSACAHWRSGQHALASSLLYDLSPITEPIINLARHLIDGAPFEPRQSIRGVLAERLRLALSSA